MPAERELRCDAMDQRSRVNDVAKNAGPEILCRAERKSEADCRNVWLTKRMWSAVLLLLIVRDCVDVCWDAC